MSPTTKITPSLIPFKTSFLGNFYLGTLFPDTWKSFKVSEYLVPKPITSFDAQDFRLTLNPLTGEARTWFFDDYTNYSTNWEEFQKQVVQIIAPSEEYRRVEVKPSDGSRNFLYISKQDHCEYISWVTPQKHEMGFDKPNFLYDLGFDTLPYNLKPPQLLQLKFSAEQAKQISLYLLSGGKSKVRFPLLRVARWDKETDCIQLEVVEDQWLHRKYAWQLAFEVGIISVDATTGELFNVEGYSRWVHEDYKAHFTTDTEITYAKPDFEYEPYRSWKELKQSRKECCEVTLNDMELSLDSRTPELHFPPLRRGESCVVFADYFPSFLIDLKRDDQTIVLRGQLPSEGKGAEVRLDSTEAILDGREINLSAPPQEIEDRLYLPHELLTLCNGVSTRWEPQDNRLHVSTEHLRRPN